MEQRILYVGLDVDDSAFHGAGFDLDAKKLFEFKCKPTLGALLKKLDVLGEKGYELRVCYEATYLGYRLCRDLRASNVHCDIIAPSLIPECRSARVKTDRTDSRKLAEYYAKDMLTTVSLPDEADEEVRQVIRSRAFLVAQRRRLRQHILSLCRCMGMAYKHYAGPNAEHWTQRHVSWLNRQVAELSEIPRSHFEKMLCELIYQDKQLDEFNGLIEELAKGERYRERCTILCCFKGIQTLSAMTLLCEIGDIRRFSHPKKIVSYSGMDIREYSSGGKEKKFGLTKMGNKRMRTTLIEACQSVSSGTAVSKVLKKRRENIPIEIVDIAVRCQKRLQKKRLSMLHNNKHHNKIKAACAREMIGFIWEALLKVA